MSIRVDTTSLIAGSLICGDRGLGILGSSIPNTGDSGPSYAYNDLELPADAGKEICGRITSWPSAGDLYTYEDTSFEFSDAPDGVYSFSYQLYVDGAATGSPATVTLNVGSASATIAINPALETSSAHAISPALGALILTLTPATESNSAQSITPSNGSSIAIGTAYEVSSVQAITPVLGGLIVTLNSASENDSAQAITVYGSSTTTLTAADLAAIDALFTARLAAMNLLTVPKYLGLR